MERDAEQPLLPPHGKPAAKPPADQQCRTCGDHTPAETLSAFGGQCGHCFGAWKAQGLRAAPDVGDRRQGPRSWAYALKRRAEAGERLTVAQRDAYRAALHSPLVPVEDDE